MNCYVVMSTLNCAEACPTPVRVFLDERAAHHYAVDKRVESAGAYYYDVETVPMEES